MLSRVGIAAAFCCGASAMKAAPIATGVGSSVVVADGADAVLSKLAEVEQVAMLGVYGNNAGGSFTVNAVAGGLRSVLPIQPDTGDMTAGLWLGPTGLATADGVPVWVVSCEHCLSGAATPETVLTLAHVARRVSSQVLTHTTSTVQVAVENLNTVNAVSTLLSYRDKTDPKSMGDEDVAGAVPLLLESSKIRATVVLTAWTESDRDAEAAAQGHALNGVPVKAVGIPYPSAAGQTISSLKNTTAAYRKAVERLRGTVLSTPVSGSGSAVASAIRGLLAKAVRANGRHGDVVPDDVARRYVAQEVTRHLRSDCLATHSDELQGEPSSLAQLTKIMETARGRAAECFSYGVKGMVQSRGSTKSVVEDARKAVQDSIAEAEELKRGTVAAKVRDLASAAVAAAAGNVTAKLKAPAIKPLTTEVLSSMCSQADAAAAGAVKTLTDLRTKFGAVFDQAMAEAGDSLSQMVKHEDVPAAPSPPACANPKLTGAAASAAVPLTQQVAAFLKARASALVKGSCDAVAAGVSANSTELHARIAGVRTEDQLRDVMAVEPAATVAKLAQRWSGYDRTAVGLGLAAVERAAADASRLRLTALCFAKPAEAKWAAQVQAAIEASYPDCTACKLHMVLVKRFVRQHVAGTPLPEGVFLSPACSDAFEHKLLAGLANKAAWQSAALLTVLAVLVVTAAVSVWAASSTL
eukprot:TRINITY_DN3268_c0_g1_i1.p1 TRINITY_DN3268_c0_g1~~TRINITY_DN3268_c0_g1_i1.p1  ORF type:complete len:695 (+),score=208.53 TRINITY_DN3268_c0_g1_i1:84-2168(+)